MDEGRKCVVYCTHKQTYAGGSRPLELIQTMPKMQLKRLQCFIAYHRKEFTENKITFHGLRHTYAHEKYDEFIRIGKNDAEARRCVSELLGHHRDDVTRIYLSGGDKDV